MQTTAPRKDFFYAIHHALVLIHGGLAVVILVGGTKRFPPPTYQPLLDLAHGSVIPWVLMFGISAALMSTCRLYADIVGAFIGMCAMAFFAACFLLALRYPTSGATAFVAYGGFFLINLAVLTQLVIDWTRRPRIERS